MTCSPAPAPPLMFINPCVSSGNQCSLGVGYYTQLVWQVIITQLVQLPYFSSYSSSSY